MSVTITILTPLHIGNGKDFELGYNLLIDGSNAYIFDEFKIVKYFIDNNILIPRTDSRLKMTIETNKERLIKDEIYDRVIETKFPYLDKPLLEHISTQNKPIVTGSSIKGAIETAIFNLLVEGNDRVKDIKDSLTNFKFNQDRFEKNHTTDKDFINIFRNLKISDSTEDLETKIYKSLNMKKDKNSQSRRNFSKFKRISNYVEAVKPSQKFTIDLKDTTDKKIFKRLGDICNEYYISKINKDIQRYYYKKGSISKARKLDNLNNSKFILNIGRFGGAKKKSIDKFRYIKSSHCVDKNKTCTDTFALESGCSDNKYYENCLIPFGWVLCEIES